LKLKVREMIEAIDDDDLYKLQNDLSNGGVYLKKLVQDKIKQVENRKKTFCTTCGQSLEEREHAFTLLFGPEDFKKKASFCELDCLEYFLAGMKKEVAK
jgi:rRNA maturation endonuclease Nob1